MDIITEYKAADEGKRGRGILNSMQHAQISISWKNTAPDNACCRNIGKRKKEKNVFFLVFVCLFENDLHMYTKGGARSGTLG